MNQTLDEKYTRWQRIKRRMHFYYLRIMRTNGTPESIAMGLALGVFAGLLPIVPLQTVTTIGLCFLFKGNPAVGALGTWITNPLNWIPVYYFLYIVGRAVVPWDVPDLDLEEFNVMIKSLDMHHFFSMGKDILASFWVMLIAGILIGTPCAFLVYTLTKNAVLRFRARRAKRRVIKKQKIKK